MGAESKHAEYDASAGKWARARDVLAGEDAVKALIHGRVGCDGR